MRNEIDQKEFELEELKQKLANKLCPFKIGDIGVLDGYSHSGKKAVITKIVYKRGYIPKHAYEAFVDVFKKDGSKSQFTSSFWIDEDFKLIVE